MINFNGASEQKEGGNGPIPPKSFVKVKLTIREPSEKKKSSLHPLLNISDKGNHSLDIEFEVVSGTFQGVKIWKYYVVSGSEKATNISMAFFRAVIESVRTIDPKDTSPGATQGRQVNDWSDFNGMEFPVKVGIEKPKAGDQYINNNIMSVVTPDKSEYQQIMAGGEIISDLSIPEIPKGQTSSSSGAAGPTWAQGQQPQQENSNSSKSDIIPDWAK